MRIDNLIDMIAEDRRIDKGKIRRVVEDVFRHIRTALEEGDDVVLPEMGILSSKHYPSKRRRVPFLGGQVCTIKSARRLTIKTNSKFASRLKNKLDAGK